MPSIQPVLKGVHHTARPTWKLRETVEFYRDKLGLPLVHAISARGWGPSNHPDFLHFFFDSGKGSTIAFFYYINTEQPDYTRPVEDYRFEATHTAWLVDTDDELMQWRDRLETQGIPLIYQIRHELIESLYFRDPNGYYLEITRQQRPMNQLDANDAKRTLDAAMKAEDTMHTGTEEFTSIDQVWRDKARSIENHNGQHAVLHVLDVPEFEPLIAAGMRDAHCTVKGPANGYWTLSSSETLVFNRKKLGFVPALWNASLTGGFAGEITIFDRDTLEITPGERP